VVVGCRRTALPSVTEKHLSGDLGGQGVRVAMGDAKRGGGLVFVPSRTLAVVWYPRCQFACYAPIPFFVGTLSCPVARTSRKSC